MKKAAFFDFDGTLANTEKLSVLATQQAFKQANLPVPERKILSIIKAFQLKHHFQN